jgi:iron complex transport system substrate-binding protein
LRRGSIVIAGAVVTLFGVLAVTLVLASAPDHVALAGGFPFSIRDASGTYVTIPAPPRRIISLAPSVTEILFALGLDVEIVGISDADDYPPDKVQKKARVGGVLINLERVVALRPDLVIGMPSLQRDQLARLRTIRLAVLAIDAASIDETTAQIRLLGSATGRVREAEDLASTVEHRAQVVRPTIRRRVYIEAWNEPVTVAGAGTLIHDLVQRAGGSNIFGDLKGYVQVPLENVLVRNPQVIFLLYPGHGSLLARPGWPALAAARDGRIYELPASLVSRPGPRIVDGLALVSRLFAGGR